MKIFTLFIALLISSCATLNISEIPDDTKILVVADTVDKFHLMYDAYAHLPINREVYVSELKPSWLLSELFVNTALNQENKSRFTLIKAEYNNIRSKDDLPSREYGNKKELEKKLRSLSHQYGVEHIIILKSHQLSYVRGSSTKYMNMEYGYNHFVNINWLFEREGKGFIWAGIDIHMYKVDLDNIEPIQENLCSSGAFDYTDPLLIPGDIERPLSQNEIPESDLLRVFESSKSVFEKVINKSIEKCLFKDEYRTPQKSRRY